MKKAKEQSDLAKTDDEKEVAAKYQRLDHEVKHSCKEDEKDWLEQK